jgi:plastocyanin
MKHCTLAAICAITALTTPALTPSMDAAQQGDKAAVTVTFGIGLNTATPGNALNHHVIPEVINVKKGGVVNFVVAGLHQIYVYRPGVVREDLVVGPGAFFFNDPAVIDPVRFFYQGIVPAGGPLALPVTTNPSNAVNRVESVAFLEEGTYLVICNVRPHLIDGMYAYVKVTGD